MRQRPWIKAIRETEVDVLCKECWKSVTIRVTKIQVNRWLKGEYIQDVMPEVSAEDREMLISGTCSSCWDKLYEEID